VRIGQDAHIPAQQLGTERNAFDQVAALAEGENAKAPVHVEVPGDNAAAVGNLDDGGLTISEAPGDPEGRPTTSIALPVRDGSPDRKFDAVSRGPHRNALNALARFEVPGRIRAGFRPEIQERSEFNSVWGEDDNVPKIGAGIDDAQL